MGRDLGEGRLGARGGVASAPRTAAALQASSSQVLGGPFRFAVFYQGLLPTVSPRTRRNSDPWSVPSQGNRISQESQLPFTEALSPIFPSKQTSVQEPSQVGCLPAQGSRPFASCAHVSGSGERESKRGVCRSQLRALLLLAPSGPCCQGLCRKPTCLVCTGVLVTREAQEATDPLLHIPPPRLPDNAGNRKALPSSFHPSSRGLCSRKTRLPLFLRKHHFPQMVAKLLSSN